MLRFLCGAGRPYAVTGPLFQLLVRKTGSTDAAVEAISDVAFRLGDLRASSTDEQFAALALCAWGEEIEKVSRNLTWRDFERFCSGVLEARGYRVRQNVILRKPRAQIDVFGLSNGISLAVDCKHWSRPPGYAGLAKQVGAQKARAKRLRDSLDEIGPIAIVILVLVESGARFVDGGAVVPVFALGDFLDNVDALRGELDLV